MDLFSPLPLVPLHILLALAGGPLHGYGILQAVREQGSGRVTLGTGSLYRHLSKLIDMGLVAEIETAPSDPRRSVSYRLTPRGVRMLTAERNRVSALLQSLETAVRHARKGSA